MSLSLRGAYVVAITPFEDNGAVDGDSIDRLVDFYLEREIRGLTVLGVSGEATRLTPRESLFVAERFIKRAGAATIIVGVSNPNTAQLAELARHAMDRGASGVMISPSAGLRTEEDVLSHFEQVYKAIGGTPTMLQDYPLASGVSLSAPTLLKLLDNHREITAIKHEDMPGLGKLTRLRGAFKRPVSVLCGNNGLFLPFELGRGADGAMFGFSVPEVVVELCRLYGDGRNDAGAALYDRYLPLVVYESQGFWGLAMRKEMLRRRGAIRSARMRPPGPALAEADLAEHDRLIHRLGPRSLPLDNKGVWPMPGPGGSDA